MASLLLTPVEKKLFDALSEDVKEGWEVVEETGTAYETPRQLQMRYHIASFRRVDAVKKLVEKIHAGEKVDTLSLDGIPDDLLPELYYTIGAHGLQFLMEQLLQNISTDDDLQTLSGLSTLRHELLATNAEVHS